MRNHSDFSSEYISNQNQDEDYPYDSNQFIEADSKIVSQKESNSYGFNSNRNQLPINLDTDFSTYRHQFDLIKRKPNNNRNYEDNQQQMNSSEFRNKTQSQKFSADSFSPYSKNGFQFNRSKRANLLIKLNDLKDAQRKIKTEILLQDKNNKQMIQLWAKQILNILKRSQQNGSSRGSANSNYKIRQLQQQNQRLRRQVQRNKGLKSKPSESVQRYQQRVQQLLKQVNEHQKLLKSQEKIIQELSMQNQELQQSIFDYQQRMVGFELQVDNKVAEIMQRNDENKRNQKYLSKIQQLNKQIQEISRKQQRNVQVVNSSYQRENELKIKQRQIMYRQKQLEQKDEQIFKRFQEVEYQREQLMGRERQLSSFQDQLDRRLGDIQIKENQLQLIKHQLNQNYKHFNNQVKHHTVFDRDVNRGVHFQTPSRVKQYQKQRSFTYSNVQPTRQKQPYPIQTRNIVGPSKDQYQVARHVRDTQRSKSKHSPALGKVDSHATSNLRNIIGKQSTSSQHNVDTAKQKLYNKTPNRNNQYKIVDHQSFKDKRKLYNSNITSQPKGAQLNGIEEKLERLKQEIRKQIDSIN